MLIVCRKDLQFDTLKVVFNKRNIHLLTHLTRMMIFKKKSQENKINAKHKYYTNLSHPLPMYGSQFPFIYISKQSI